MITWPVYNGKSVGIVLATSSWEKASGVIADETVSGKLKVRAAHIKAPNRYKVVMHMTLYEYRFFIAWWEGNCRRGVYSFSYPCIDDNTGDLKEYRFTPDSSIAISNTSGDNLEVSMEWLGVV